MYSINLFSKIGLFLSFFCVAAAPALGQCSGSSLTTVASNPCPGDLLDYSVQGVSPQNYNFLWQVSAGGTIVSGQGTATMTVVWNSPAACGNCPYEVSVVLTQTVGGNCVDTLSLLQNYVPTDDGYGGATKPYAGDTCWYMRTYTDGVNSQPSGSFSGVVGGTIINSFNHFSMGSSSSSQVKEQYIQVVWGSQGAGSVSYMFDNGQGGGYVTTTTAIDIGPVGNIDPAINGPVFVCIDDTATFSAVYHPGSTYKWVVHGGLILSGQGTREITVYYPSPISFNHDRKTSVMLTEVNGCRSASTHKQVTHNSFPDPFYTILSGPQVACNSSQTRYIAHAVADSYTWTVTGGNIMSGQGTDTVVVQWPFFGTGTGTGNVSVTIAPRTCFAFTRDLTVQYGSGFANYPQLLTSPSVNLGDTVTYSTPLAAGHTYSWSVSAGGSILSGQGTNSIQVVWVGGGPQVVVINEFAPSCGTQSQSANINVIGYIVEASASDSTLQTGYGPAQCATLSVSTNPTANNPTYLWSTGATSPTISVCPTVSTTYSVTVTDPSLGTASDDVLVEVEDLSCGTQGGITICRGQGQFTFTQCVPQFAVPYYLGLGASLGSCVNKTGFQNPAEFYLGIHPNPAQEQFQVDLVVSQAGDYTVDLLDQKGRQVGVLWRAELEAGEAVEIRLKREGLSAGLYFLQLAGPGVREMKKLVLL